MTVLHRSFLVVLLLAASAHAGTKLPLESGTYIEGPADMMCADAANAGTLYFDGKTLHGPHLEFCTTAASQVGRDGKTFETQSVCDDHDKSGHPLKQNELRKVKVTNRTHFQELVANSSPRNFHRCGAYPAR